MRRPTILALTVSLALVGVAAKAQPPEPPPVAAAFLRQLTDWRSDDRMRVALLRSTDGKVRPVTINQEFQDGWKLVVLTPEKARLTKAGEFVDIDLTQWTPPVALTNAKLGGSGKLVSREESERITKAKVGELTAQLQQAAADDPQAASNLARFQAAALPGGWVQLGGAINPRTGEGRPLLIQMDPANVARASISADGRSFVDITAGRANPPPGVEFPDPPGN